MYFVHPLPQQIDQEDINVLLKAEPATIGHFLHMGFMDKGVRAVFAAPRVAGTAVTVCCPGPDNAIAHYALGQLRRGDVLVIDRCNDHHHASLGGAFAYAAREIGVAGIVVDGVVTDLEELQRYGVPIWSRGLTAITVKTLGMGGALCRPVSCGGVAVCPGDAILADENGVLVLPRGLIQYAAQKAIGMQQAEKATLQRLDQGQKYPDIIGSGQVVIDNLYDLNARKI